MAASAVLFLFPLVSPWLALAVQFPCPVVFRLAAVVVLLLSPWVLVPVVRAARCL